ncbi:MAG: sigma factor-like helix-turn-helix DNA-binding protein, partial [Solirubrobacteraceae bacterium]
FADMHQRFPAARWIRDDAKAREMAAHAFGGGDEPTPLVETGRRLGISQDTVRRLERKALAELASSRELDALRPAA